MFYVQINLKDLNVRPTFFRLSIHIEEKICKCQLDAESNSVF